MNKITRLSAPRLLAFSLISAAACLSGPARAEETPTLESAPALGEWRKAVAGQYKYNGVPPAPKPNDPPKTGPVDSDDQVRIDLEDPNGKRLATMEMTKRTLHRYRYLYAEWAADSQVKTNQNPRLSEPYLGKLGGRDMAAIADLMLTGFQREGTFTNYELVDTAVNSVLALMKGVDRLQNGSYDFLGETDDMFRLGGARYGSGGLGHAPVVVPEHVTRIRVRLHDNGAFKHGAKVASAGLALTDDFNNFGPFSGQVFIAGERSFNGKNNTVLIGLNGPWPNAH